MTRINADVAWEFMTDQHLLAEHREIKRMCSMFIKRLEKNKFNDIPNEFTLNKGHMTFYLDKGAETYYRYSALYNECINRGFDVEDYSKNWDIYQQNPQYFNEWRPTPTERERANKLVIERITERILKSKQKPRYHGKVITKIEAIRLINQPS